MSESLRVAVVQMDSGPDPGANLDAVATALDSCVSADAVILPEVCLLRGGEDDYRRFAAPFPNDWTRRLGALARSRGCYLLAGSLPEREDDRLYNTSVLFNVRGGIEATYRKIHLFECLLPDGTHVQEGTVYHAGTSPALCHLHGWTAGMSVCYDIRFPALFGTYARRGATIMLVPSDFTAHTGRAHWHLLVRARAIETQSYVLAPNQCGTNPASGVESYGHSLIVSPWGDIVAEADEGPAVLAASLDGEQVRRLRQASPVLANGIEFWE